MLVGIFALLLKLAKPRGLENAVYTVAAVTLLGLLLGPLVAAVRMAANPSVRARLRWLRLAGTFAVLGGIAAAILAWPVTRRITAPLVAVPAQSHALFAVAPGELRFTAAEGAWVERGEVVARLANPELELALAAAEDAVRERRVHLAQLRTLQATLPASARMLPAAAAELADAEAHLAEQQTMADSLVIRAPAAGRVLAPPPRAAERIGDDTLPTWTGSPLDERNLGAWIEQGTPLAVIAPSGPWTAWAGVDQSDAPDVQPGQQARIIVDQHPTTIFTGRVTEVSRRARDNSPAGAAAPPRDADTLGDDRYHVVKLTLDAPSDALLASARGTTKIAAYDATVGELLWRNSAKPSRGCSDRRRSASACLFARGASTRARPTRPPPPAPATPAPAPARSARPPSRKTGCPQSARCSRPERSGSSPSETPAGTTGSSPCCRPSPAARPPTAHPAARAFRHRSTPTSPTRPG